MVDFNAANEALNSLKGVRKRIDAIDDIIDKNCSLKKRTPDKLFAERAMLMDRYHALNADRMSALSF